MGILNKFNVCPKNLWIESLYYINGPFIVMWHNIDYWKQDRLRIMKIAPAS